MTFENTDQYKTNSKTLDYKIILKHIELKSSQQKTA